MSVEVCHNTFRELSKHLCHSYAYRSLSYLENKFNRLNRIKALFIHNLESNEREYVCFSKGTCVAGIGGIELTDLHLSGEILVLVADDGQRRFFVQGVGAVSEGLLRGRRGYGPDHFFLSQTVAAFMGAYTEIMKRLIQNSVVVFFNELDEYLIIRSVFYRCMTKTFRALRLLSLIQAEP